MPTKGFPFKKDKHSVHARTSLAREAIKRATAALKEIQISNAEMKTACSLLTGALAVTAQQHSGLKEENATVGKTNMDRT